MNPQTTSPPPRRLIAARRAFKLLIILAASLLALELFLRAILLGHAPMLPCAVVDGATVLPPRMDLSVSFEWRPARRYVTDDAGSRIASPEVRDDHRPEGLLVVGDSQVLGYGLEFSDTFAARLAADHLGDPNRARIFAAPALAPEGLLHLLTQRRDIIEPRRPRLTVVALNLGNDLDELFFAGFAPPPADTRPAELFLGTRSYLYMEVAALISYYQAGRGMPVNGVISNLDSAERVLLASETAQTLHDIARQLAPAPVAYLIVPCCYQLSPDLFRHYRNRFESQAAFDAWYLRRAELASKMNAVQQYLRARLQRTGSPVLCITDLLGDTDPAMWFDPDSLHLTAEAHRLIAAALAPHLAAAEARHD